MKRMLITLMIIFTPVCFSHAQTTPITPIKILLVPGHDDETWGAQYGTVKEADMNLVLANKIYNILKLDKRFQVYITRNSAGYNDEFINYFEREALNIAAFRDAAKKVMQEKIDGGSFEVKEDVPHNNANERTSIILYGINKWANENKIDAIVHIHFNDYPRPSAWTKGEYKGFSIYIPEDQLLNASGSSGLAQKIFTELRKKYATSTYPLEAGGLVKDQSLIALGSNLTLNSTVRSILIEYGYIYRFGDAVMRRAQYPIMAGYTATGIKNYFFSK